MPWFSISEYPPKTRLVSPSIIRQEYNAGQYWQKALNGELETRPARPERHADPEWTLQPYCTMSQTVEYFTLEGIRVARVHQYLRPDGTIGGSGRPDPKWLYVDGLIIAMRSPNVLSRRKRFLRGVEDIFWSVWLRMRRRLRRIKR